MAHESDVPWHRRREGVPESTFRGAGRRRAFPRALSSFRVWLLLGCPLGLAGHAQISARWSSKMNLFTIIGIIVVVLFVAGYFGLH